MLLGGLVWFYWLGATEHARVVNNFKARGDQNSNLGDGEAAYANRHGHAPPVAYGDRNRMPLYGAFLGLLYDPTLTDPQFFEVAKLWNIRLSLAVLAVFAAILFSFLPAHAAANLTLVMAFGVTVFKAGYVQPEVLFHALFFVAFLSCFLLFRERGDWRAVVLAIVAGVFAALAQLTKASVLPFVAIVVVANAITGAPRRLVAAGLMAACFLAVMFPYMSYSKRVYGQYFYNVNTTFYVWYNDWPEASVGTHSNGDGVGWPTLPADQIPSAGSYWRTHTVKEMLGRELSGFEDMLSRSYHTFWYLKYVTLYAAFALALVVSCRREFVRVAWKNWPLVVFLSLYGIVYLAAIAFYFPISGTGTARFLLPHVAPLLFVLSYCFGTEPFRSTEWRLAGVTVTPAHFHVLVSAMLGSDVVFIIWPRLMTTYGGF